LPKSRYRGILNRKGMAKACHANLEFVVYRIKNKKENTNLNGNKMSMKENATLVISKARKVIIRHAHICKGLLRCEEFLSKA
jgi:hypothetical protein